MISRRHMLQLAGGFLLSWPSDTTLGFAADSPATIKGAVAGSGTLVGITVGASDIASPAASHAVLDNFNMVTPGTAMKWAYIHPEQNSYSWPYSDSIVAFAKAHGLAVHGHNLCWNLFNPAWVQQTVNPSNARSILESHIQAVAGRYRGEIDTWDVVNEPVRVADGKPGGFMAGPWYDALGPEFIDIAFHAAASTDPKAIRQINLDSVEQDSDAYHYEATRNADLAIIKAALQRGVPIQSVGIESHLRAYLPLTSAAFSTFIRQVKDLGLAVAITELDVDEGREGSSSPAAREQTVADYYARYLEEVIPLGNVRRVGFWTLSDKNNWLDAAAPRADHQERHPGLMNDDFVPDPACYSVEAALKGLVHR